MHLTNIRKQITTASNSVITMTMAKKKELHLSASYFIILSNRYVRYVMFNKRYTLSVFSYFPLVLVCVWIWWCFHICCHSLFSVYFAVVFLVWSCVLHLAIVETPPIMLTAKFFHLCTWVKHNLHKDPFISLSIALRNQTDCLSRSYNLVGDLLYPGPHHMQREMHLLKPTSEKYQWICFRY